MRYGLHTRLQLITKVLLMNFWKPLNESLGLVIFLFFAWSVCVQSNAFIPVKQLDKTPPASDVVVIVPEPVYEPVPQPVRKPSYVMVRGQYPMPEWVDQLAEDMDQALVLAIVKKESRFNPYAGSYRGAQGLMQIMPETASYIRQKASYTRYNARATSYDLTNPEHNLAVGQAYLRYLQKKPYIRNNIVYLLTAYNAGPGNLIAWQKTLPTDDMDVFVDSIPFAETRTYVRQVLHDYRVYRRKLEGRNTASIYQPPV